MTLMLETVVLKSRYDLFTHFSLIADTRNGRNRCAFCKKTTPLFCQKCNVFLCQVKGRNCFYEYHHESDTDCDRLYCIRMIQTIQQKSHDL